MGAHGQYQKKLLYVLCICVSWRLGSSQKSMCIPWVQWRRRMLWLRAALRVQRHDGFCWWVFCWVAPRGRLRSNKLAREWNGKMLTIQTNRKIEIIFFRNISELLAREDACETWTFWFHGSFICFIRLLASYGLIRWSSSDANQISCKKHRHALDMFGLFCLFWFSSGSLSSRERGILNLAPRRPWTWVCTPTSSGEAAKTARPRHFSSMLVLDLAGERVVA